MSTLKKLWEIENKRLSWGGRFLGLTAGYGLQLSIREGYKFGEAAQLLRYADNTHVYPEWVRFYLSSTIGAATIFCFINNLSIILLGRNAPLRSLAVITALLIVKECIDVLGPGRYFDLIDLGLGVASSCLASLPYLAANLYRVSKLSGKPSKTTSLHGLHHDHSQP